ncbi:MAG: hypothetical protein KBB55_00770 [Candidatus Buchananbacteria bacterium]|nr:hypothetical protein [Candidatus Buchananbacteria bacterium]
MEGGQWDDQVSDATSAPLAVVDTRSKQEKTVIAAVILVAFLAVVLGFTQLSRGFNQPFVTSTNKAPVVTAEQLVALETKDTDGDGLSDYVETTQHKTSPYLEDSDSDGMTDKAEVDASYDPNCPGTASCLATNSDATGSSSVPTMQTAVGTTQTVDLVAVRQALKASGATDAEIASLSDEQLASLYQQATANYGGQFNAGTPTTGTQVSASAQPTGNLDLSSMNITSLADLQKLTGAQIRQLMISQGAPAAVLEQVSDDQLKTMFMQQLQTKTQQQ